MAGDGAGSREPLASRLVDVSLAAILAASPFLARGGGRGTFPVLAIIAVGGVVALYQRGSRARRISRCAWLLFFAIAVAAYLALQAMDAIGTAGEASRWAAMVVKWGLVAGLAGWGFVLALQGRAPRLADAFDWGAALTIGILLAAGASFAALGERAVLGALATPCAVLGMHFVVREQCRSLHRARRLAQMAMISAIVALAGWAAGV
jgi:hypothetical protein